MTKNHGMEKFEPCTMDIYLKALTYFMKNNGKTHFSETMSNDCIGKAGENADTMIRNSFARLICQCHIQNARKIGLPEDVEILTLFTSWSIKSSKNHVHNNTVVNWSTFMPRVNLVLFTNDSGLSSYVEDRGWVTFPIVNHAAGGVPVLKYMFETVMKTFNSTFYGYANSDILFDSSLITTLTTIFNNFENTKPIFISGRRTNVDFLTSKEAASYGNIQKAVKTRGTLYDNNAEDFFITNKHFDWLSIPEVVIGRRAYDNWLVFHARSTGTTTVDVSRTLLALHQTTEEGNKEGHTHSDPDYNHNLLTKLILKIQYEKGFTSCMKYETFQSLCDETEITERLKLPNYCGLNR